MTWTPIYRPVVKRDLVVPPEGGNGWKDWDLWNGEFPPRKPVLKDGHPCVLDATFGLDSSELATQITSANVLRGMISRLAYRKHWCWRVRKYGSELGQMYTGCGFPDSNCEDYSVLGIKQKEYGGYVGGDGTEHYIEGNDPGEYSNTRYDRGQKGLIGIDGSAWFKHNFRDDAGQTNNAAYAWLCVRGGMCAYGWGCSIGVVIGAGGNCGHRPADATNPYNFPGVCKSFCIWQPGWPNDAQVLATRLWTYSNPPTVADLLAPEYFSLEANPDWYMQDGWGETWWKASSGNTYPWVDDEEVDEQGSFYVYKGCRPALGVEVDIF